MSFFTNKMEVLFWKHSTKSQEQKGASTLYLRITVNGSRVELGSTGLKIRSADWDDAAKRLTNGDPLNSFKNEQLNYMEMRLWGIFNDLMRKSEKITADRIKRAYMLPENVSFLTASRNYGRLPGMVQGKRV